MGLRCGNCATRRAHRSRRGERSRRATLRRAPAPRCLPPTHRRVAEDEIHDLLEITLRAYQPPRTVRAQALIQIEAHTTGNDQTAAETVPAQFQEQIEELASQATQIRSAGQVAHVAAQRPKV